jgi:hypothetical protein
MRWPRSPRAGDGPRDLPSNSITGDDIGRHRSNQRPRKRPSRPPF